MSRSYKRVPCWKDHPTKEAKRFASKMVRRYPLKIPNGSAYKKLYDSWDLCDYRKIETFQDYKKWKKQWAEKALTDKEIYREWYVTCKRK